MSSLFIITSAKTFCCKRAKEDWEKSQSSKVPNGQQTTNGHQSIHFRCPLIVCVTHSVRSRVSGVSECDKKWLLVLEWCEKNHFDTFRTFSLHSTRSWLLLLTSMSSVTFIGQHSIDWYIDWYILFLSVLCTNVPITGSDKYSRYHHLFEMSHSST